jgi:hypothetical protein
MDRATQRRTSGAARPRLGVEALEPRSVPAADLAAAAFHFDAATYSVGEAAGQVVLTITRTGDTSTAATVQVKNSPPPNFTTAAVVDSATAGSDYTVPGGTNEMPFPPISVDFAAGETTKTVAFGIIDDTAVEGDEFFRVYLLNPDGSAAAPDASLAAQVTITDNDQPPSPPPATFSLGAAATTVDEGVGQVTFTVTRSGDLSQPASVGYEAVAGSASAGSDFTPPTPGSRLTFAASEATKTFTVPVINDIFGESDETLTVRLTAPQGGTLGGTAETAVTISANDNEPAGSSTFQFDKAEYTANEGNPQVVVTVTRGGDLRQAASVQFATVDGSATGGQDFVARGDAADASGILNFAAGEASKTFTVTLLNDTSIEGLESFRVRLENAAGAMLGGPYEARVSISDNDGTIDQRFVSSLYWDLLGRAADTQGMTTWTNRLSSGGTRMDVVAGIVNSLEYTLMTVKESYRTYFGREADDVGLHTAEILDQIGLSREQHQARLLGSQEYFVRNGSTNEGFLAALYRDALGRDIDAGGLATFSQLLAAGTDRTAVAYQVLTSQEASESRIRDYYADFLRREPSAAEIASWVQAMKAGTSEEVVIARFLGSTEYNNLL